ncbi:hypothetical protein E2N92_11775 [Methanofollis formosanus]|uniref:PIN domain-containing protein n=1 Tax=Methanofollis formosanus TaxID=299308 RepID=A0A8G1EGR0_9EURY|nr:hypothetical protein [Methanofollis formosanus]QYZ80055.1 hypothetical protein E2N92_11775 [Methanofollis formosanus]
MTPVTAREKVWFLDTNVFAHWVLGEGKVLRYLCDDLDLHDEFFQIYQKRYHNSITFIEKIFEKRQEGLSDEFYVSSLATNELFAAIRDEVRSILFFKNGVPISRWRDARNNPDISAGCYEKIYEMTLQSFDSLFENHGIVIIPEFPPWDDPNYWSILSSILFLIKETKTQDATLLTTAILNRAHYFVTLDTPLIRSAKKSIHSHYSLALVNPTEGLQILRNRT